MSDIKSWSTVAAENNAPAPDGFPEGMAPGHVNNAAREMMAAIRRQHEQAEWINLGHEPSFASSSSFTVAGDVTSIYHIGRRVRLFDTSTLYGRITASSYNTPSTTITVDLDDGSISSSLAGVSVAMISGTGGNLSVTPETIGAAPRNMIADADGDTQVHVEKSADEDIIRFDAGGVEVMRLTPTGMRLPSANVFTGPVYSLFAGGGALNLMANQFHETILDIGQNGGNFQIIVDGQYWRTANLITSSRGLAFHSGSTTSSPGRYLNQSSLQENTTSYAVSARGWDSTNHWGVPNYGHGGGFGYLSSVAPFCLPVTVDAGKYLSVSISARYDSGYIVLHDSLPMKMKITRLTQN